MAYLGGTFDATQVQPDAPRELIPAGDYKCIIIESEMAATSKGGQMLKLTLQIIEGEHQNRMLWDRLNLVNDNPKAVEIAQRTLSAICHAVGRFQVSDSAELHNLPLIAAVKIRPEQNGYGPQNEIKGYKAANAAAAPDEQPFQAPAQQSAPAQAPMQQPGQQPAQQPAQAAPQGAPAGTPPWLAGKAA